MLIFLPFLNPPIWVSYPLLDYWAFAACANGGNVGTMPPWFNQQPFLNS